MARGRGIGVSGTGRDPRLRAAVLTVRTLEFRD